MYKILTNSAMPESIREMVAREHLLIGPAAGEPDYDDDTMLRLIADADALLVLKVRKVKNEWLDAASRLKVVGCVSVGFDNVDVAYAAQKHIAVVHTPNAVREATAEMAIALMLSVTRGVTQYHNELKETLRCSVPHWFFDRGMMVYGKTLGIVGCGRVGKAVATRAQGLGMDVVYYDPFRMDLEQELALHLRYMELEDVLRHSDVVSIHMPYMPSTHHLMNDRTFALMKPTAYFLNTARGPIVEEAALARALKNGVIRGAALDVFEFEPEVTKELAEQDNVVMAPHVGTMLLEVRRDMVEESLSGIRAVLSGGHPVNLVPSSIVLP